MDEVVCFILLRLCFNCLRNAWLPGGYPPKKDASKVSFQTTLSLPFPDLGKTEAPPASNHQWAQQPKTVVGALSRSTVASVAGRGQCGLWSEAHLRCCGMQALMSLAHIAAGPALLHALGDRVSSAVLERLNGACEASWMQRAVDVYRELLSSGYTPRAHIIERVLACLRQPAAPRPALPSALPSPFKVRLPRS